MVWKQMVNPPLLTTTFHLFSNEKHPFYFNTQRSAHWHKSHKSPIWIQCFHSLFFQLTVLMVWTIWKSIRFQCTTIWHYALRSKVFEWLKCSAVRFRMIFAQSKNEKARKEIIIMLVPICKVRWRFSLGADIGIIVCVFYALVVLNCWNLQSFHISHELLVLVQTLYIYA